MPSTMSESYLNWLGRKTEEPIAASNNGLGSPSACCVLPPYAITWFMTEPAPADSPQIVTCDGSPPNLEIAAGPTGIRIAARRRERVGSRVSVSYRKQDVRDEAQTRLDKRGYGKKENNSHLIKQACVEDAVVFCRLTSEKAERSEAILQLHNDDVVAGIRDEVGKVGSGSGSTKDVTCAAGGGARSVDRGQKQVSKENADPPPPWIQTMTGRLEPSHVPAGALMSRTRQSSDWIVYAGKLTIGP